MTDPGPADSDRTERDPAERDPAEADFAEHESAEAGPAYRGPDPMASGPASAAAAPRIPVRRNGKRPRRAVAIDTSGASAPGLPGTTATLPAALPLAGAGAGYAALPADAPSAAHSAAYSAPATDAPTAAYPAPPTRASAAEAPAAYPAPVAPPAYAPPETPPGYGSREAPEPRPERMVRRTPSHDRQLDCDSVEHVPERDWRRRTAVIGVVGVSAAVTVLALGFLTRSTVSADLSVGAAGLAAVQVLLAAVLGFIGVGAYAEGYLAGLWLISPLSFGVAAVATVSAYLLAGEASPGIPADPVAPVFVGAGTAVFLTAAGGFIGRAFAWRSRAQMGMFDSLKDRYSLLCSRYGDLDRADEVPASRAEQYEAILAAAHPHLVTVRRQLYDAQPAEPSLRWILATGYTNILRTLHRVEELFIVVEPEEVLVGDALQDWLRLSGSTMADRDALRDHLIAAVRVISAPAAQAFFTSPPASGTVHQAAGGPSAGEARAVLREIRYAVNEFRDDRIEGLIRARQRLIWTALAAGGVTYLLLDLALLRGVPKVQVATAAGLYLVAALVGLFNRLRIEADRSSAVEDFGLYLARLITAPLVSGLAGVAGVFLIGRAPQFLGALTGAPGGPVLSAADIFDVTKNESAVVVAAIFGLAPAQLTGALQHQADRFERDLEKSQSAGGSTQPDDYGQH